MAEVKEPQIMKWDDWSNHPTWKTERQHLEAGLIPGGEPVARVWYSNKHMQRSGQAPIWLLLFDTTLAQPKVISEEKQAAVAKAKETAQLNRTCPVCGQERNYKIEMSKKYGIRFCIQCEDKQDEITRAREWLANPDVVILDTETDGLNPGSHVLSVSILDPQGNLLLNTYIKPDEPIDESLSYIGEDWYGNEVERPTAFAINGIGNETVKDAPDFPTAWAKMLPILEGKMVLCYNVAFDKMMIEDNCDRFNLSTPNVKEWRCVMEWYAMYHGEYDERRRSYRWVKLVYTCEQQSVVVEDAHDAHGDCRLTLGLIKAIAAKLAPLDKPAQTTLF